MPYAVNQGIRIHYQIEGDGEPLVLQHGFTDSLETWYDLGYVEALRPQYRLISTSHERTTSATRWGVELVSRLPDMRPRGSIP